MVIIRRGDILDSDANIIAHQVNCMGFMNDGLAKRIRETYPQVFERYKKTCEDFHKNKESKRLLGKFQVVELPDGQQIYNIFGQYQFGRDKCFTNYDALREALTDIESCARLNNQKVALPYKLGCGLSGGEWTIIEAIIIDVFAESEVVVELWKNC